MPHACIEWPCVPQSGVTPILLFGEASMVQMFPHLLKMLLHHLFAKQAPQDDTFHFSPFFQCIYIFSNMPGDANRHDQFGAAFVLGVSLKRSKVVHARHQARMVKH